MYIYLAPPAAQDLKPMGKGHWQAKLLYIKAEIYAI